MNAFDKQVFGISLPALKPDGTPYYGGKAEPQLLSTNSKKEEELFWINQALRRRETLDFQSH